MPKNSNDDIRSMAQSLSKKFGILKKMISERAPFEEKEGDFLKYPNERFKKDLFEITDPIVSEHKKLITLIQKEMWKYYKLRE